MAHIATGLAWWLIAAWLVISQVALERQIIIREELTMGAIVATQQMMREAEARLAETVSDRLRIDASLLRLWELGYPRNPSTEERAELIRVAEQGRASHQYYLDHPGTDYYFSDGRLVDGRAEQEHHRYWVDNYDRMIASWR